MEEINVPNGSELTDKQLIDAFAVLSKFCVAEWSREDGCTFCRLKKTCKDCLFEKGFVSLAYKATEELYGEDEL